MIQTIPAMAFRINTPTSSDEEKKIKGPKKISAILAKFCMHVPDNQGRDRTSRNANINVIPSCEIENIKKRLDQKLLHGAQRHPRSSKIDELSSKLQPISRFSSQDSEIPTSSLHARDCRTSDTSVLSDSRRRHQSHVVKKEKKACPRCGRWCKYARRSATSSLVVVCVNCGKRFQTLKKELDKSRS